MQEILSFFKYLATSNTINFIIMLVLLGFIIKKFNLEKIFDNGIEKIKSDIQKSNKEKEDSKQHLQQAQKFIDDLPKDLKMLDKNCDKKIDIYREQIKESTKQSISNINKNIKKSQVINEKKISNIVTEDTAQNAIRQAEENIIYLLKSKPEYHDKFIQNSIKELDKVKL